MDVEELARQLAVLCEKHNNLALDVEADRKRLNHNLERIGNRLDDLNATMGEHWVAAQQLAGSKPSWATTTLLTVLSSVVVGLATFLLTH